MFNRALVFVALQAITMFLGIALSFVLHLTFGLTAELAADMVVSAQCAVGGYMLGRWST